MVQIKQKRGIGVENPSLRSFSGGVGACERVKVDNVHVGVHNGHMKAKKRISRFSNIFICWVHNVHVGVHKAHIKAWMRIWRIICECTECACKSVKVHGVHVNVHNVRANMWRCILCNWMCMWMCTFTGTPRRSVCRVHMECTQGSHRVAGGFTWSGWRACCECAHSHALQRALWSVWRALYGVCRNMHTHMHCCAGTSALTCTPNSSLDTLKRHSKETCLQGLFGCL